jgi:hypothetical protein
MWKHFSSNLTNSLNIEFQLQAALFLLMTGESEDFLGGKGGELSEFGQVLLQLLVKAIKLAVSQRTMKGSIDVDVVDGEGLIFPTFQILRVGNGKMHGRTRCVMQKRDRISLDRGW